jgi:hypothetical protein
MARDCSTASSPRPSVSAAKPEEVAVVAVPVVGGHEALRPDRGVLARLRRHGRLVDAHRIAVAADAHVDVRRHVDEVRRLRCDRAESIGGGERAFGLTARVEGVDQEVVEAGMHRLRLQPALQAFADEGDVAGRPAGLAIPPVAARRDHHGFGPEHKDVGIVRVRVGQRAHALGVDDVERIGLLDAAALQIGATGIATGRKAGPASCLGAAPGRSARSRRRSARALARSNARRRLVRGEVAPRLAEIAAIEVVDVRTRGLGYAPGAHRAARVGRECAL